MFPDLNDLNKYVENKNADEEETPQILDNPW